MRCAGFMAALAACGVGAAAPGARAQCPGFGDCCVPNGTPGCENPACCADICNADPYCCAVVWDGSCANMALESCAVCGAGCPGSGNCCEANGSPGCENVFCCLDVCAADPFCCDTLWDQTCASAAQVICVACVLSCPGGGDCCVDNGTPGCNDAECCALVCSLLPFCCDSFWDGICASHAAELCDVCQPVCLDPYLEDTDTFVAPGEAFPGEQVAVFYRLTNVGECPTDVVLTCEIRPAVGGAFISSPECDVTVTSAPGSTQDFSRCFNLPAPAVPGLYEVCYEIQDTGGDPFDSFCRNDLVIRSFGDLTGDGTVGVVDFLILLEQWGPCAACADCPADLDRDCQVGVNDFLILLANWGQSLNGE
jgi:hypothetical protein